MQRAIVAVEDERFTSTMVSTSRARIRPTREHTSAARSDRARPRLTMQYVKNVLVTAAADEDQVEAAVEQTTARKLQEIRYAVQVERELTKDDPQPVPQHRLLRPGAYGVEAASPLLRPQRQEADPAEAATLAGIVQSPVGFDPLINPE